MTTPNISAEKFKLDSSFPHQIVSKVRILELENPDAFRADLFKNWPKYILLQKYDANIIKKINGAKIEAKIITKSLEDVFRT